MVLCQVIQTNSKKLNIFPTELDNNVKVCENEKGEIEFKAGVLKNFYENWRKITSDQNILDIVCHCHIEFLQNPPIQKTIPYQRICDKKQEMIIDLEIQKLLELGV